MDSSEKSSAEALWKALDRLRSEGVDFRGTEVNYFIHSNLGTWNRFSLPDFIKKFLLGYLENPKKKISVLDPCFTWQDLLTPLINTFNITTAVAIAGDPNSQKLSTVLHEGTIVDCRLGDPAFLLDGVDQKFDIVISSLPLGGAMTNWTIPSAQGEVKIRDFLGNLVLLKSSLLLKQYGIGIFTVTERFFWDKAPGRVQSLLESFDLNIQAALYLSSRKFSSRTTIPGYLVIVKRGLDEGFFVGEVPEEVTSLSVLLDNLKSRKEGRTPHLGRFVDSKLFVSFNSIVAEWEIDKLGEELGFPRTTLEEVMIAINSPQLAWEKGFEDLENSIYIPTIGVSDVVSKLDDLKLKPQNYIQVVLDQKETISAYLAGFLSSVVGQKIRDVIKTGSVIRKINKSNLKNLPIYVPDIPTQIHMLSLHSKIVGYYSSLETLERELWRHPKKLSDIEKSLASLTVERNFETWLETLPFPLASILWIYHTDDDIDHRIEHLFHFFEATAEFNALLMLSSLFADEEIFEKEIKIPYEQDAKYRDWIFTPSFGNWVVIGKRMGKFIRTILSGKDKGNKDRVWEIFGRPETEYLDMIINTDILNTLEEISKHRNRWKGHGGVVGIEQGKERLSILEAFLSEFQEIVQDRYNSGQLLSPGQSIFSDGIYRFQAKLLMGTHTPFRKTSVETLVPMDEKKLYLLHGSQMKPVELLPLICFRGSPKAEQNACYFYNGYEEDGARYVSYHYEEESEVNLPSDESHPIIQFLASLTTAKEETSLGS